MGNRCIITTKDKTVGVYLHWNGGRDSVEAFLMYCKLQKFRSPEQDNYGWARLCQIIGNYFGTGGLSIGIDTLDNLPDAEYCDNGIYIIQNWEIIDRVYPWEDFTEQQSHDILDMLEAIDNSQPEFMQLTEDKQNRKPEFRNWVEGIRSKE